MTHHLRAEDRRTVATAVFQAGNVLLGGMVISQFLKPDAISPVIAIVGAIGFIGTFLGGIWYLKGGVKK